MALSELAAKEIFMSLLAAIPLIAGVMLARTDMAERARKRKRRALALKQANRVLPQTSFGAVLVQSELAETTRQSLLKFVNQLDGLLAYSTIAAEQQASAKKDLAALRDAITLPQPIPDVLREKMQEMATKFEGHSDDIIAIGAIAIIRSMTAEVPVAP